MVSILRNAYFLLIAIFVTGCIHNGETGKGRSFITIKSLHRVQTELLKKCGESDKERIIKGSSQLAVDWRKTDGSNEDFVKFCDENFLSESELSSNFRRIQDNLEMQNGYLAKIRYKFNESDAYTDTKEEKADRFFRESVPESDPYKGKLAFFIKLNYPFYTYTEKIENAKRWNREKWAMVRLGDRYAQRQDPDFKADNEAEAKEFQKSIGKYFFRMDHICMSDGSFPFSKPLILHCHFGLRDNLKEEYTRQGGLKRHELTGELIEHILMGNVPKEFIQDTATRWNPWTNQLFKTDSGKLVEVDYTNEGTKRYAGLLVSFRNRSSQDKLYPDGSTVISRTFENANLNIDSVETLIRNFLSDPVIPSVGRLIAKRLGRSLQPFDIWYSGFQSQSSFPANMLDSLTRKKYPNPRALQSDIPSILVRMGFPSSEANYIGSHTLVRPIVSGGYSDQPPMRGDTALLTTVFDSRGLDYKAFRIAMHELGHVVCGIYTTHEIDHYMLADVPTSGITEGIAEMLAYKNTEGLGLKQANIEEQKYLLALATVWYMVDLGGQALNEIETWKWMYAHPEASPETLRDAVLNISSEIWNAYYSPVFNGIKDQHILSIYNHFITGSLYLYNYFIGDAVMFQLYDQYMPANLAEGLKKACREGQTMPDLWMKHAVGRGISLEPLLKSAKEAVVYFDAKI